MDVLIWTLICIVLTYIGVKLANWADERKFEKERENYRRAMGPSLLYRALSEGPRAPSVFVTPDQIAEGSITAEQLSIKCSPVPSTHPELKPGQKRLIKFKRGPNGNSSKDLPSKTKTGRRNRNNRNNLVEKSR